MRLWSLHPQYLDRAGLTACWREGLLAKKVLEGNTKGYRNHPQLVRFKETNDPLAAINAYLHCVVDEAEARSYNFDRSKLTPRTEYPEKLIVTEGQMLYEWQHLRNKHQLRSKPDYEKWADVIEPLSHPIFRVTTGPIADWEKVS